MAIPIIFLGIYWAQTSLPHESRIVYVVDGADDTGMDVIKLALLALCLIGMAFGFEGFRRPAQSSVAGIIGIVVNGSLIVIVALARWFLERFVFTVVYIYP